ncbi:SspB-related isopeptide-forming adhesin [Streptococcus hyointestinalis]|uniref:SspB-related isopeptide-forming adhesin n=1 Tax=Streptococcus hyointestinalis TaxID=1337 RepID=UPI003515D0D9
MNFQAKTTKGHGFFRKSKAYGLVCGIALGTLVFAGQAHADEVTTPTDTTAATELVASTQEAPVVATQPTSTNDNDAYAKQANTSTGTETVAVDNSAVESAVKEAQDTGVAVSQDATQDQGTPTTSTELDTAKEAIKADQDKQVEVIKATTTQQAQNNTAYEAAQSAITANNDYVADAQKTYEADTTVSVTTNTATATDGTAKTNTEAKKVADSTLDSNKKAVETYVADKKVYDATVASAKTLNDAIEAASTELKKSGATVTTSSQVVHTVDEVNSLTASNNQKIADAQAKIKENTAKQEAYNTTKAESDKTNSDASQKADELKKLGATVTTTTKTVTSAAEAKEIASQNQKAYDAAKQKQAEWQKTYDELQANTTKEGYTKQVVLQALDFSNANPNATVTSSAQGAEATTTPYIASSRGASGYGRILDSTSVLKYANVGAGWTTELDYTNLSGITVTTADGVKRDITRIHRSFQLLNNGATGLDDVYVLNDPTEGFVVSRNNGTDSYSDYMNFAITDTYYYTVDGQEVAFTASDKTPVAITFSSLNNNAIGREGARATNGTMVEINGSTVSVHDDNMGYANSYNSPQDVGVEWDTTTSPYQYKGAVIGYFTNGSQFQMEFAQWDGPANSGGQTYWFAINTKVVSPVIEPPVSATIVKTVVNPVTIEPVTVALVKAENPAKPTLALTKLANTKNQQLKASYHNYSLHYKPVVSKSVSDTDNANTDGKTVAKGDTEVYTLTHDNIYANVKVGDPITITDPLEAGVIPAEEENLADNTAKGWTVAYDKDNNTYTFTATYKGKKLAAPTIKWKGEYDNAYYDNTYKVTVGNNTYTVFSNTVNNRTPEPPKPVKSITDNSGADINGASVMDKNVNFHLTTDYKPYTTISASKAAIEKGFAVLDDVQDGAFTVDEANIKMTADNKDVKDLFTMYHVLSDEARTEAIQKILDNYGMSPVGEFYLWVAKAPNSFYENYVKQAKNVTIDLPARLNVDPGVKVYNDFFQIDFGNSYQSNQVVVERPDIQPEKHALDKTDDSIVLDNQTVQIGDYIRYLLDGVTVPVKHDTLWQYDGVDQLDTVHDRYTGNYKGVIMGTQYTAKEDLVLPYDVTLEDGTFIKAGDTIKAGSKYAFRFEFDQDTNDEFINKIVKITWDAEKGKWSYSIDKEFLHSLGIEGTFDVDFYLEVERIAAGDVTNTFVNIVNGQEMEAKVITHTPEKPKTPTLETPTPAKPQAQAPVAKQAALPTTGANDSFLAILAGLFLSGAGLIGIRRKKQNS